MTPDPIMTEQAEDRFRQPAPLIDLTPEVIENLHTLLDGAQKIASATGLPWRSVPSGGKPILCANEATKGCAIAYGTIGSWKQIDLAVAAVNALPALLAALVTPTAPDLTKIVEVLTKTREVLVTVFHCEECGPAVRRIDEVLPGQARRTKND